MNPLDHPRGSEIFVPGPTVITFPTKRRTRPPTEVELIRDELRSVAETKADRKGRLLDRLAARLRQVRPKPEPVTPGEEPS